MAIFENTEGQAVVVNTGANASIVSSDSASLISSRVSFSDARNELSETQHIDTLDKAGHVSSVDTTTITRPGGKEIHSLATDEMGNRVAALTQTTTGRESVVGTITHSYTVSEKLSPGEPVPDLRHAVLDSALQSQHRNDHPAPHVTVTEATSHEMSGKDGSSITDVMTRTVDSAGHETRGLDTIMRSVHAVKGETETRSSVLHQDDHGNKSTTVVEELSTPGAARTLVSQHSESVVFHDARMEGQWPMPMEAHRIGQNVHDHMTHEQKVSDAGPGGIVTTVPATAAQMHEGNSWSFGGGLGGGHGAQARDTGLSGHTQDSIVGFLTEKAGYAAHEAKAMVSSVSEYLSRAIQDPVSGGAGSVEFHKAGAEAVSLNHGSSGTHANFDGNTASIPVDVLKAVHESGRVQDLASRDMGSSSSLGHELSR